MVFAKQINMIATCIVPLLALGTLSTGIPLVGNTWTLHVEGTAPGSGEVRDTESYQSLPGFNHMLSNQSATDEEDEPDDTSLGITLEGVCKHMTLSGDGKIGQTTLEAECVDEYGIWWITSLNLNECAANVGGLLAYYDQ
jgi:hypothetical protein